MQGLTRTRQHLDPTAAKGRKRKLLAEAGTSACKTQIIVPEEIRSMRLTSFLREEFLFSQHRDAIPAHILLSCNLNAHGHIPAAIFTSSDD